VSSSPAWISGSKLTGIESVRADCVVSYDLACADVLLGEQPSPCDARRTHRDGAVLKALGRPAARLALARLIGLGLGFAYRAYHL
jgi:hypothetical protein